MKDSQNQNQTKLELQMMESRSLRSNTPLSQDFDDDVVNSEQTQYKPNALESLSSKIDQCLNKQKELNFIAREVSQVLKKLK